MFIGHFGVGFGAKAAAPRLSLGSAFLAAQFIDLLWPTFLLLGIERVEIDPGNTLMTPLHFVSYPYSHSLLLVIGWSVLVGLLYLLARKNVKGAMVLSVCVVSHWVLDLIVHGPDLPLYPGDSPLWGFGLWNSMAGTFLVEGIIFGAGLAVYVWSTRPVDRIGTYGFWALVGFLVLVHVGNVFSPPPPGTTAIAWFGQLQWLLVVWAYWIDRHRVSLRAERMPGVDRSARAWAAKY